MEDDDSSFDSQYGPEPEPRNMKGVGSVLDEFDENIVCGLIGDSEPRLDESIAEPIVEPIKVYTIAEIARLDLLEANCNVNFPLRSAFWNSVKQLRDEVAAFCRINGFCIRTEGNTFKCTRSNHCKSKAALLLKKKELIDESKQRNRICNIVGCKFYINYTKVKETTKNKPELAPIGSYIIAAASYRHTNGCIPGSSQLAMSQKANGTHQKKVLKHDTLKSLLDIERAGGFNTIGYRNYLRKSGVYPEKCPISSQMILNLRMKLLCLIDAIDSGSEHTVEMSNHIFNACAKTNTDNENDGEVLDLNSSEIDFVTATTRSQQMLRTILKDNSNDAQRMLHYLKGMSDRDPNFTFRVSFDCDGSPTGFIWMTGVMRREFELNGTVIFLDCMKRQTNNMNWPYIAPVVLDADTTIFEVAECIICAERIDAYAFVMESLFSMAPNRSRDSVRIIFGDGIMSDRLLEMIGISNTCRVCFDVFHLMDVDWPRNFGIRFFLTNKAAFSSLVYSKSEHEYNENIAVLRQLLLHSQDFSNYLEMEIHANRQRFVRFWVTQIEGNMERRGDTPAESNHASFVRRIGPIATVEPVVAAEKMIQRSDELSRVKNARISKYYLETKAKVSQAMVNWQDLSVLQQQNTKALQLLCRGGKELWETQLAKASNYTMRSLSDGSKVVKSVNFNEAFNHVYTFRGDSRCCCKHHIAFLSACCHEICADGMIFNISRWPERYHQRSAIEISTYIENRITDVSQADTFTSDLNMDDASQEEFYNVGNDYDNEEEDDDDECDKENCSAIGNQNCVRLAMNTHKPIKPNFAHVQSIAMKAVESIMKSKNYEAHLGGLLLVAEISAETYNEYDGLTLEQRYAKYTHTFTNLRGNASLFASRTSKNKALM